MSLDSGFLKAIVSELKTELMDCKVDRVHQIDKDNLVLSFRGYKKSHRVILCANANNARLHFTQKQYENPASPPMFCMLLRKHLQSARLIDLRQPDFERIAEFCFEGYNELGELQKKYLTIEIMGRHSNIIFYDDQRRIIDSIKHVDMTMSLQRQVLPGLLYEYPPAQHKKNPLELPVEEIHSFLCGLDRERRLDKVLLDAFTGLAPIVCRELVYRATGQTDACLENFSQLQIDKLEFYMKDWLEHLQQGDFTPTMIREGEGGKPREFSYFPIRQYTGAMETETFQSPSALLEAYYDQRDHMERMRQKSADIFKVVMNNMDRVSKKITLQEQELEQAAKREEFKIYGDLLMSNLFAFQKGDSHVVLQNYYDNMAEVDIPLDILKNPSQNAQQYYKLYQKAKATEEHLLEQVKKNKEELAYLETVFDNLYKVESEKELNEMRLELKEQGYLFHKGKGNMVKKGAISKPMHFCTDDGFDVLVGKNNKQNDELTLRTAERSDLWLHTKLVPGSHTVILLHGTPLEEIPDKTITQAAILAATYSQARESQNVPVDYAFIRHVKKPGGAKPGMVIYDHYYTAYATPDEELAKRLRVDKVKR